MRHTDKLQKWFHEAPAPWRIGQLLIRRSSGGPAFFEILHADDRGRNDLEVSPDPLTARRWLKFSSLGEYRPLKAEANLAPGWMLAPLNLQGVAETLNIFYPTAVANWNYHGEGRLQVTLPEETFSRQTGMYHIVRKATQAQIDEVATSLCSKRCLKCRLWGGQIPRADLSEIPLLCPEVCNLFVAGVRGMVKGCPSEGDKGA